MENFYPNCRTLSSYFCNFILINPRLCRGLTRFDLSGKFLVCSHLGLGPGARALRTESIGRERDLLRDSTGFPQDEAVPAGDQPVVPTGDG